MFSNGWASSFGGRPLTGARIETLVFGRQGLHMLVAPERGAAGEDGVSDQADDQSEASRQILTQRSRQPLERCANEIVGSGPKPVWLARALDEAAIALAGPIVLARDASSARALRDRLEQANQRARELVALLDDADVLLAISRAEPDEDLSLRSIAVIARGAAEAASQLVVGRGKRATVSSCHGAPDADLFCASLVWKVWVRVHGKSPSPRNSRAWAACAALSRAAGSGTCKSNWRADFEQLGPGGEMPRVG